MDKIILIEIMKDKIALGWGFDKIFQHLLVFDDLRKINKEHDSIYINKDKQ